MSYGVTPAIRLTGKALDALRLACFERDGGVCYVCGWPILYYKKRFEGDPDAYDMAHIRNKRMWGDHLGNVRSAHHGCHMRSHNCGGKPIKISKESIHVRAEA